MYFQKAHPDVPEIGTIPISSTSTWYLYQVA